MLTPFFERMKAWWLSPTGLLGGHLAPEPPALAGHTRIFVHLPCDFGHMDMVNETAIAAFFIRRWRQISRSRDIIPIFIRQARAMRYSRFLSDRHVILDMLVPDNAISGRCSTLVLKPSVVTPGHIYGSFLANSESDDTAHYLENPLFNNKLN